MILEYSIVLYSDFDMQIIMHITIFFYAHHHSVCTMLLSRSDVMPVLILTEIPRYLFYIYIYIYIYNVRKRREIRINNLAFEDIMAFYPR
jgi:hypothetical protein